MAQPPQQQQQQGSSSDKRINAEIHQAIRSIQACLFKEEVNTDREIVEHFKILSRSLDGLVERTRKRQVESTDDKAANLKRQKLAESRARIRGIFKLKN